MRFGVSNDVKTRRSGGFQILCNPAVSRGWLCCILANPSIEPTRLAPLDCRILGGLRSFPFFVWTHAIPAYVPQGLHVFPDVGLSLELFRFGQSETRQLHRRECGLNFDACDSYAFQSVATCRYCVFLFVKPHKVCLSRLTGEFRRQIILQMD